MKREEQISSNQSIVKSWAYWGMIMQMTFSIVGTASLGWTLDTWQQTQPLCTLIGVGVGCSTALFVLVRMARRLSKEEDSLDGSDSLKK